jgi:GT2 family glycosyltransferase
MIVIVVVNWNGTDDTIECLESLMRINASEFRILVMDNGSDINPYTAMRKWTANGLEKTPSHPSWLRDLAGPRRHEVTLQRIDASEAWDAKALVTLVEIGWNSGFAHANNVGIKMALDNPKVDYIWLLNNDTIVTPDTLGELVKTARMDPQYAIIGSTLVYYHHGDIVQGVGASYNLLTARTGQIANKSKYADLEAAEAVESRIDFVIGASMFVTRTFVESAGLLDDRAGLGKTAASGSEARLVPRQHRLS